MRWLILTIGIGFFLYPQSLFESVIETSSIWLYVLVPSLFPMLLLTEWLMKSGIFTTIGKLFTRLMRPLFNLPGSCAVATIFSFFSGYPVCSRIAYQLFKQGELTEPELLRFVGWATTADPLYIAGAVAIGLFHEPEWILLLWFCHYGSAIFVGIFSAQISHIHTIRSKTNPKFELEKIYELKTIQTNQTNQNQNTSQEHTTDWVFSDFFALIKSTLYVLMMIGKMLLICSLFIQTFAEFVRDLYPYITFIKSNFFSLKPFLQIENQFLVSTFLIGLTEVTLGLDSLAEAALSKQNQLILCTFFLAWGGISVHFQSLQFIKKIPSRWKYFLVYRIFHACIASMMMVLLTKYEACQSFVENFVFVTAEKNSFSHEKTSVSAVFSLQTQAFTALTTFILMMILVYWLVKFSETRLRWGFLWLKRQK